MVKKKVAVFVGLVCCMMRAEVNKKRFAVNQMNTKIIVMLITVLFFSFTTVTIAFAESFGDALCGASSVELVQIMYKGSAWNYPNSGYNCAWFKYIRDGRTLMYRKTENGYVEGVVTDDVRWGSRYKTKFRWGRN